MANEPFPIGTNLFVASKVTTQTVHVAMCNAAGFARYAVQLSGTSPDLTVNVYANACQTVLGTTGQSYINTAADGLAPVWSAVSGGAINRLLKMTGVNLNGPLQYTMALSTVTGTYVAGETVTDGTSGATAIVVVGGTTSIVVKTITGTFGAHTITGGTSGATGTWVSNTALSTVDQTFTISVGTTFLPTSFFVTNASISLTTASGIQMYTGIGRTGTEIGHTGALSSLTTPSKVLNGTVDDTTQTIGTPVNVTLTTPQGAAATADIYLFGYQIA